VLDGADESVYRTGFAVSRQWVLSEHKLLGEAIVPGTTYLEMAAAAAGHRFGRPATMLKDVTFYVPLLVSGDKEVQVHLTIRDVGDDRATFTVASRTPGEGARDNWTTHARGSVSVAPLPAAGPADPAALRAQCSRRTVDTAAMQAEHRMMEFGPRWTDSLRWVHVGVRSALGELALPVTYAAECAHFRLHPALLDLATGFGALAVPGADDDPAAPPDERDFFLPIGYDSIEIHRPLPACGLSLITLRPSQETHADLRVADVLVCDEEGQQALAIHGFTARRVADPQLTVTRLRPHQRHHRLTWVADPHPAPAPVAATFDHPVLIVGASAGRTAALAGELRGAGASARTVLIDAAASATGDIPGAGPAGGADLGRVAPTAEALSGLVAQVGVRELVFIAADATVDRSPQRLRAELQRGAYALFYLLKAAVLAGGLERLTVVAPTVRPVSGTERVLAPQHAALFGLAKVFALEQDGCSVLCIDDDGDAAAVRAELCGARTTSMIALRDGARLVQLLAPVRSDGPASAHDPAHTGWAGAVAGARNYLITGGLGGLGLAVAEHLSARRPDARIALVGRSAAPPPEDRAAMAAAGDGGKRHRQARALLAMCSRGTDVRTFAADVADQEAMRAIVAELTAQWGPLDCVVHAAGVAGDGFLFRKDAAAFAATVAPKVLGAAVLDQVTSGDIPPAIISFGSTVSVFGAVGQSDYTAANDYLAAFADERSARGRPTATLAWSDWLEVGMAVDNAVAEHQGFFRSLTPAEALSSFDHLADAREPNTIIGEVNTAGKAALAADDADARFRNAPVLLGEQVRMLLAEAGQAARAEPGTTPADEGAAEADVVLHGREDGAYTPSERALAGMWASELGLDRLDIGASSFTLGGDSLTALRMVQRIEKVMNIDVSIVDLFQYETVAELAAYLDGQADAGERPA
jgi:NAD(P)-dependent dehydrogenase (short-subunit alcohol dehydrogenase family)/acyl carrier protein